MGTGQAVGVGQLVCAEVFEYVGQFVGADVDVSVGQFVGMDVG